MKMARSFQLTAAAAYLAVAIHLVRTEVLLIGGSASLFIFALLGFILLFLYFPIINVLPAASWGKTCAYAAYIMRITLLIALFHHQAAPLSGSLGSASIFLFAIWIATASWQGHGLMKIVGLLLAVFSGLEAFVLVQPLEILTSVLSAAWLFFVARTLSNRADTLPMLLAFPRR